MECSARGSPYGTMSLLCAKGVLLPPAELPFQVSFKAKSESLKNELYPARCTLCCFQYFKTDGSQISRRTWTNSVGAACNNFLCIPSNHGGISRHSLSTQEKFSRPYCGTKLQRQHKLFPYLVVKAEVTGTGSPDVAFELTEICPKSKVRGICFYAVTALVAIFLIVAMAVGHPFVLLLDPYRRKFHHFIAKMWAILTVTPFFTIKFEGLENLPPPDTPAVYVSNHQSFLDIYTLLTVGRPFKFISKTSIFLFPVVGWAMFLLRVIPLKRMDSRSQLDCLKRCMDLIRKGASVFFFPEGTRSKDGKLGSFKKGAFSVAAKTKVPVVPITLIGTGALMPSGKEGILKSGFVKVVIHKPIEGSDPVALCNETRNIIANVLNKQG